MASTRILEKHDGADLLSAVVGEPSTTAEWVWFDLTDPTVEDLVALGEALGIDEVALEDGLDEHVPPKYEDLGDHLEAVLHPVVSTAGRVDTTPLVCFVGATWLVTIHAGPLAGVDYLWDHAQDQDRIARGGADRMLGRLADVGGRRFLPLVEGLDEAIQDLELVAVTGNPEVLAEAAALQRDAAALRATLSPQRDVLRELARSETALITDRARRRLADATDLHSRMVESLESSRLLLMGVVEVYRGAAAERANEVMKVLTVFSATLLPLTVMAGVYGMNFERMPELGTRWGYQVVLGAMATTALGLWLYFVRRGFVGGPRLPRVPRAVGRGLVHLVDVPVRTVGALVLAGGSLLGRDRNGDGADPGADQRGDD